MARPGRAIFDVSMMAGWAFAAVLTGLVALTMVDDTGDSADGSSVVATLESDDARLVTGSLPQGQNVGTNARQNDLVGQQNRTFDPFAQQSQQQSHQIELLIDEMRSLKQEVQAFHVSTRRLRDENNLLKQRLAKLELGRDSRQANVRVVELPKRDDDRSTIILQKIDDHQGIDPQATGSIAPIAPVPKEGQAFDPFTKTAKPKVKITEEPLTMDVAVDRAPKPMILPKVKPAQTLEKQRTTEQNPQQPSLQQATKPSYRGTRSTSSNKQNSFWTGSGSVRFSHRSWICVERNLNFAKGYCRGS